MALSAATWPPPPFPIFPGRQTGPDYRSAFLAVGVEAPAFALMFDQKSNHATLLGVMKPEDSRVVLPCVLHLPDMGTLRITGPGALDYDASRRTKPAFVRIAFPPATAERRRVEYRLEVTAIYPKLPGIERDPRYDGFRRDWLNIFQVNPRVQMLANNAASDPCAFTLFLYSDLAAQTPPLADGLMANDLVRMTLDRYLAGAKGYGQVGYTDFSLGLSGNLVPVKKGDYVHENNPPEATGEPRLDDGSDGFQFYENGGATGCWVYYTVKALYRLGRAGDARRIFYPMLAGYSRGEFQGFCADGRSRDWRDWRGGCHGYEGLLVDNYHALLAVLDDVKAKR